MRCLRCCLRGAESIGGGLFGEICASGHGLMGALGVGELLLRIDAKLMVERFDPSSPGTCPVRRSVVFAVDRRPAHAGQLCDVNDGTASPESVVDSELELSLSGLAVVARRSYASKGF